MFITQPGAASINLNKIHCDLCLFFLRCRFSQPALETVSSRTVRSIPCCSPNQGLKSSCNLELEESSDLTLPSVFEGDTNLFKTSKIRVFSALSWSLSTEWSFLTIRKNGRRCCPFCPKELCAPGPAPAEGRQCLRKKSSVKGRR